jgi:hypothetical protein
MNTVLKWFLVGRPPNLSKAIGLHSAEKAAFPAK